MLIGLEPHPFITVVSGLPRSGTSMMMQMLAAGGMPLLTDRVRTADADNPRGYFEFEPVKRTRIDPSWVPMAVGKAVKVVTVLLRDLPAAFDYRVILIYRDPDEVLASQKAMLKRLGRTGARASDEQLKSLFINELESTARWLATQPNYRMLRVNHRDCIAGPEAVAKSIDVFLGEICDTARMAGAVDNRLYRNVLSPGGVGSPECVADHRIVR